MAHLIEIAPTGRAKCRGCGTTIAAKTLRLGERVVNSFADDGSETTQWFHLICGVYRRPEAFLEAVATTESDVPEREMLTHEASLGVTHERLPRIGGAERAASGRATCRSCREVIAKDAWRLALVYYEEGRFVPSGFVHVTCAPTYCGTRDLMPRVTHFSPGVAASDLDEVRRELDAAAIQPPANE